jgi:MoaA/NifB/PqqE/SkfB family radical SAM enzyme
MCCASREPAQSFKQYIDTDAGTGEYSPQTLEAWWNGEHMRSVRVRMINGETLPECEVCNNKLLNTAVYRSYFWNMFKDKYIQIMSVTDWKTGHYNGRPISWDYRFSNLCNFKCRMCGDMLSSSTFATEEINFIINREEKKKSFHYQMLRDGAWPRNSDNFWHQLDSVMSKVRYIEFTGGEPFMIREHFDLLRRLVDRGYAHQIEIHYNTNGTQYPEEAEDIWRYFYHVEIAFSIDDVGERFEYQRTNAGWSEVNQNIERFRLMRSRNRNITLQVCCTINTFNVLYLPDVANWIKRQDFDFVYWNMLHDPYYFSIATLPDSAKQAIQQRLTMIEIPAEYRAEFDRVIDFMMNGASTDGKILRMKIEDLDFKRHQDLKSCSPELARVIEL